MYMFTVHSEVQLFLKFYHGTIWETYFILPESAFANWGNHFEPY